MTLEAWILARQAPPPAALVDRMRGAARESQQSQNSDIVGGARIASLHLLKMILAEKDSSRSSALDLLTADALMTYSCEAACDQPESLERESDNSIQSVLSVLKSMNDAEAGSR